MDKKTGRHFQKLEIGLASSHEIQNWAERYLPNGERVGEVTSWETVNYKTLKPELNGLFCQRIFGPVIDYTCACGKKSNKVQTGICPKCGVERTTSRVRRYRLGYIQLKQPVIHSLYATHKPSPIGLSLKWSNKRVQAIMYGTEFCHLSSTFKIFSSRNFLYALLENNGKLNFVLENTFSRNESKFQKNFKILVISKLKILLFFQKTKFWHQRFCEAREWEIRIWQKSAFVKELAGSKNQQTLTSPKLFGSFFSKKRLKIKNQHIKNKYIKKFYPFFSLDIGTHLYAIAYDMTWRQVEDLQDFLMYLIEQPFSYEYGIPYYRFAQTLENHLSEKSVQHHQYYPIQTGGFVFQKIFSSLDLIGLQLQLRLQHADIVNRLEFVRGVYESISKRREPKKKKTWLIKLKQVEEAEKKCLRGFQYIRDFYQTKTNPAWMVLSVLPVLPPGLRPITSIRGELVVSDINSLYRKLLTRNKRVGSTTQFGIFDTALSGSWSSWCYNLRQVQEAVDSLLKTGSTEGGKTTKSLLDTLKGKKGRFRQHLLGKRVDYSGRSVIVVGPKLKIHECGIPKQMAIHLFQPFLIQKLRTKGIAFTTTAAKSIISERKAFIWNILEEIMRNHPILLNRAPTLHRLGIQAFLPKLVEGKAILLHPLVCPAFNADFDGDQMAVHVPLSSSARAEAFNLLWARNNLLSPASGQPLLLPTQDMVLGCYYLTISKDIIPNSSFTKNPEYKIIKYTEYYFSTLDEVQQCYDRQLLKTHLPIWIKCLGLIQNLVAEQQAKVKDLPLECRLDIQGNSEVIFYDRTDIKNSQFTTQISYLRTTAGRLSFQNYLVTTVCNQI